MGEIGEIIQALVCFVRKVFVMIVLVNHKIYFEIIRVKLATWSMKYILKKK